MATSSGEVTELLRAWEKDPEALDRLLPLVMEEVRTLARRALLGEGRGYSLEPTELLNEVYLRLVGRKVYWWKNRAQFFSILAELMRRILVDRARRRLAAKRGSGAEKLSLDEGIFAADQPDPQLILLDDALQQLKKLDPMKYKIVSLSFFVGLSQKETAKELGVSVNTVGRHWQAARLWLQTQMLQSDNQGTK